MALVRSPDAATAGVTVPLAGPAIALCTSGAVSLGDYELERGQVVYVVDESSLLISGDGMLFVVSSGR